MPVGTTAREKLQNIMLPYCCRQQKHPHGLHHALLQAVAGPALVDYLNSIDKVVKQLGAQFKTRAEDIPARVAALTDELKSIQKQLAEAQSQAALAKVRYISQLCGCQGDIHLHTHTHTHTPLPTFLFTLHPLPGV